MLMYNKVQYKRKLFPLNHCVCMRLEYNPTAWCQSSKTCFDETEQKGLVYTI